MNKLDRFRKGQDLKQAFRSHMVLRKFWMAARLIDHHIFRPAGTELYCLVRRLRYCAVQKGLVRRNPNEERLEQLRGSHVGETAFVIGSGPSLKAEDLDLLKEYGAYSFGCNRIYLIFDETLWRPDCYAAIDRKLLYQEGVLRSILDAGCDLYFFGKHLYECIPQEERAENMLSIEQKPTNVSKTETEFSAEPGKYLVSGYTVTNLNLQMAVYMGFTTICLLGIDCRYANVMDAKGNVTHHDGVRTYFKTSESEQNQNTAFQEGMLQAYRTAKVYADKHGLQIYNCSAGSALDVFTHRDLRDVLEKNRTESERSGRLVD